MSEFIEKVLAKNVLFTNMPLDIEIKEKGFKGIYKSILYEYNIDLNLAKIGMPIHKGAYIKIPREVTLSVKAYSKNNLYLFNSLVYGIGKESSVRFLIITVPDEIYRVQRRNYVRIPLCEEGFFSIKREFNLKNNENLEQNEKYRFVTKDFSAGGAAIVTKKQLSIGDKILINMKLKDEVVLENIEAEVVREIGQTQFEDNIYGIKFIGITGNLEKELVRFVFKWEIGNVKNNNS
ncbi:MAG TPA: PilZ domain-containing protein [Defluviitoga tunisiensis]|jgi:c-di-GMP-binding flagellar brake protein YcgR|uniref:Type IV pilus assembly PilZ n=1 Tax=Defluviitoga tunisiensis TaxID=1006576 RepID=A0A0C7NLW9_DEFTU|nr:PilZ domain-containing protein [Defluviitoga tunisiensis]MDD3601551.1 PilZ domain-containing protein [Defluviitoga tunisiensis]MDY0380247.1 PilZ domain-containing protein [Defluviitoga tunisiensis]CEP78891.1 type IV pilus assembly PilZ [Defluviitoga tunisiensis]HHV01550.1 flagellar brake protein [Defluviitoga tunisiensis]HOB55556.1 PilZ domain-containing protein [Defluviitoga tunisiensis]